LDAEPLVLDVAYPLALGLGEELVLRIHPAYLFLRASLLVCFYQNLCFLQGVFVLVLGVFAFFSQLFFS